MTVLVEEVEVVALVLLATVAARLIVIVHVQGVCESMLTSSAWYEGNTTYDRTKRSINVENSLAASQKRQI